MYNGLLLSTLILILLFLLGVILSFFINLFLIPIFTTPRKVLKELVEKMNLKDGDTLYDLGSGDGRVLLEARKQRKIKGVGVEISPVMMSLAKINKRLKMGLNNDVTFEVDSMFDIDISKADVIYIYGSEQGLEILREKFKEELKNTTVFSYRYKIPNTRKRAKKHTLSNDMELWEYKY